MYERFGSTEYTGGWLEEAGEINFGAFDVLKSRIGRQKNKEFGLIGKILITCNPKKNWLYVDIYKPFKQGELPKVPIYVDGMVWDINAIHTAYPDFLSMKVRNQIFQDQNPFTSEVFSRVGSPHERKEVIEGGPCIVIATSGMLVGGASVEYFKEFAENKDNLMILSCYQGPGSLGRQIQEGAKTVVVEEEGMKKTIKVNMEVVLFNGLSPHAGRGEIISFFNNMRPKPKRIIVNHGEVSKSLDLASSLYKLNRVETNVPRGLETLRLK